MEKNEKETWLQRNLTPDVLAFLLFFVLPFIIIILTALLTETK